MVLPDAGSRAQIQIQSQRENGNGDDVVVQLSLVNDLHDLALVRQLLRGQANWGASQPGSAIGESESKFHQRRLSQARGEPEARRAESPSCDLDQRLAPAHQRRQLCFWFDLGSQERRSLLGNIVVGNEAAASGGQNGSHLQLASGPINDDESQTAELLVEAELHLFKLPPEHLAHFQFQASAGEGQQQRRGGKRDSSSGVPNGLNTGDRKYSKHQVSAGKWS